MAASRRWTKAAGLFIAAGGPPWSHPPAAFGAEGGVSGYHDPTHRRHRWPWPSHTIETLSANCASEVAVSTKAMPEKVQATAAVAGPAAPSTSIDSVVSVAVPPKEM